MNNLLISIAMCTYNGEQFLKEQLESILNQTYRNIELIITDDCSTDSTINIIKTYQNKDNRIKLYENKKNLGFVKNFEKSISLCNGEYIALADQDDIWKLNKIDYFLERIGKNILIYSDAKLIDKYSLELNQSLISPDILVSGRCNKSFLLYNSVSGNTMMFRQELLQYILPIPETIAYHDIWIAFIASTISTIHVTDDAMTYYRRHQNQVTRSVKPHYPSFKEKMKEKELATKGSTLVSLKNCLAFSQIEGLDKETKLLIDLLIEHYNGFENGFFNIKLFLYFLKYKDEVFGILPKRKRLRYARKIAIKLKLRKIFLYKI